MRVQSFVKVPSYLGWWMQPRFGLKISELDFYRLAGGRWLSNAGDLCDPMWFYVVLFYSLWNSYSLQSWLWLGDSWGLSWWHTDAEPFINFHKPSFHISACPIGPPAPSMFQLQVCHCLTWPGATGIWHELPVEPRFFDPQVILWWVWIHIDPRFEGISSPSKGGSMLPRNLPNKKKPSRTTEGRRSLISW